MDIEVFRQYITVARHLNISKAARELNVSQPTLSRSIAAFERELGQELFTRSKPLRLTPAGRIALSKINELWFVYEDLRGSMKTLSKELKGKVRVQDISQLSSGMNILLPALQVMEETYPNVDVELIERLSGDVQTNLLEKHVDIGFFWMVGERQPDDCEGRISHCKIPSYENEMFIAIEKDHPLATKEGLVFKDFKNEHFIYPSNAIDTSLYQSFTDFCREQGFEPKYELSSCKSTHEYFMLRPKSGATFFSRSMIEQLKLYPAVGDQLVFPRLEDTHLVLRLYLAYRAEEASEAVRAFIRFFTSSSPAQGSRIEDGVELI